jgi:PcfK-like protein
MLNEAVEKIKSEMTKNNNNPYIHVVGNFMLEHLQEHPEDAEKVLTKDKTIVKSMDEVRKAAEKKKVGNMAVLTDQEGFKIVLGYFGIKDITVGPAARKITPVMAPMEDDFDVKLDDFL